MAAAKKPSTAKAPFDSSMVSAPEAGADLEALGAADEAREAAELRAPAAVERAEEAALLMEDTALESDPLEVELPAAGAEEEPAPLPEAPEVASAQRLRSSADT